MQSDGCVLAVDRSQPDKGLLVERSVWCSIPEPGKRAEFLKQAVKELAVQGLPTVVVLGPADYSLLQIEAPDLPEDELREAARWRIKDMVDFSVESAVIDVFRLPESKRPGAPKMMYVVASKGDYIAMLAEDIESAGLALHAIDISEMAVRNLIAYLDQTERPRAYLYMQPGFGLIEIGYAGEIYLTRQINLPRNLTQLQPEHSRQQMEELALEVQRSLDYFESQYAMGSADQLMVLSSDKPIYDDFAATATLFLTVPVAPLGLQALAGWLPESNQVEQEGLRAIGAAIRELRWAA